MKSITGCGIYAILNVATGRAYIGSSMNVIRRWKEHRQALEAGTHGSPKLRCAWRRHGAEAFHFVFLEQCTKAALSEREEAWIITFDAVRHGYNVLAGPFTDGFRGGTHSAESRAKMAAAQARNGLAEKNSHRVWTPEARARMSEKAKARWADPDIGAMLRAVHSSPAARERCRQRNLRLGLGRRSVETGHIARLAEMRRGTKHTAETRAKMSAAHLGRTPSAETRSKLSERNRGQGLGRHLSLETRRKISTANTGRPRSASAKAKHAAWLRQSDHLIKLAEWHRGRTRSIETREKIAAGNRRRWEHWRAEQV